MSERPQTTLLVLLLAYVGFISLGLPDAVTGVAWPSVRNTFSLPQAGLGAVLVASGAGYLLSSLLTPRFMAIAGVGTLLVVSTALMAFTLFGYATVPAWVLFVGFAVFAGLGSGAIDTSLNNYAAHHFSLRHMNWLHACYSLGAAVGPLVMTAVLARGLSWRWGYAVLGGILAALAVAFALTRSSWTDAPQVHPDDDIKEASERSSGGGFPFGVAQALRRPLVWGHAFLFFLQTGLEVTSGQWCYTVLTEWRGLPGTQAGIWNGCYWAAFAGGRVVLGAVAERIGADRLVRLGALMACLGTALFGFAPGVLAPVGLVLVGFGLAPVFPTLMSRTPSRLGRAWAVSAVGIQVSASMLGAAAVPSVAGLLAGKLGLGAVGWVTLGDAALLWAIHEGVVRGSEKIRMKDEG